MFDLNPDIVKEAKEVAALIIVSGEKTKPIKFGNSYNTVFVSLDPKAVIPAASFEIDKKVFYVGLGMTEKLKNLINQRKPSGSVGGN